MTMIFLKVNTLELGDPFTEELANFYVKPNVAFWRAPILLWYQETLK